MKLISCHITAFGGLRDVDIDFGNDGLFSLCEKNGYGKSTVSAFLCAMLYKPDGKENSERIRYMPVTKEKQQGSLTFSSGGSVYRIEKTFEGKKGAKDSEKITKDNNVISVREDIGEYILGIDRESFKKLFFISGNDVAFSPDGAIAEKLGSTLTGGSSGGNYDTALEMIAKQRKVLKADRGTGGIIPELGSELFRLRKEYDECKSTAAGLASVHTELEKSVSELASLRAEKKKNDESKVTEAFWESYERMIADCEKAKAELSALCGKYPAGFPGKNETNEAEGYSDEYISLGNRLSMTSFPDDKEKEINRLSAIYGNNIPDENTLRKLKNDIISLNDTESELRGLEAEKDSLRYAGLSAVFGGRLPDDEKTARMSCIMSEYAEYERQKKASAASNDSRAEKGAREKRKMPALTTAAGALFVLIGIILFFILLPLGAALSVIGIVILIAGMRKDAAASYGNSQNTKTAEDIKQEERETELRSFVMPFGYYTGNGIGADFELLRRDREEYIRLTEENKASENKILALKNDVGSKRNELSTFFAGYSIRGEDYAAMRDRLLSESEKYSLLVSEKEKYCLERKALLDRQSEISGKINGYFSAYHIKPDGASFKSAISAICADIVKRNALLSLIKEKEKEAEKYAAEKGLGEKPLRNAGADKAADYDVLIPTLEKRIGSLGTELSGCERAYERMQELGQILEEKIEKAEALDKKYRILQLTADYLKEADEKLKRNYLLPVYSAFDRYSELFGSEFHTKLNIDRDLNVSIIRNGIAFPAQLLSDGEKTVLMLLFRIALVDNMFARTEKPPVFLDDPFVCLDKDNMEKAKRIIRSLSEDRQIIYFTCHESRKINNTE